MGGDEVEYCGGICKLCSFGQLFQIFVVVLAVLRCDLIASMRSYGVGSLSRVSSRLVIFAGMDASIFPSR